MAQCFCRTGVSASERSVGQWLITPMLRAVIKKKGIWTVSTPIAAAGSLLTTLLLTMPTTTHDKSNCRFARPAIDPLVEVNDRMVWLNVCVRWDVRPVSSVPDSRSDAIPSLKQKKKLSTKSNNYLPVKEWNHHDYNGTVTETIADNVGWRDQKY